MYIGYNIVNDEIEIIGCFKDKESIEKYNTVSTKVINNYEEIEIIDVDTIKTTKYIDFYYETKTQYNYSIRFTHILEQICDLNTISIINNKIHIKIIIKKEQSVESLIKQLLNVCPKILLGKELSDIQISEENKISYNGVAVKINNIGELLGGKYGI